MPKRSSKPRKQKDTQQLARHILDSVVPDAEPPKKPAANKPNAPNSEIGVRQLPDITARHPLYIGPKQNPTLAPMPTKPSARPLASGNKRAIRAVAAG